MIKEIIHIYDENGVNTHDVLVYTDRPSEVVFISMPGKYVVE